MQGTTRTADGAAIAYEVTGSGPPLLLISGFAASRNIWEPQLADWSRKHTVIRLDNRHVGASSGPGFIPWIPLMGADALAVLDALGVAQADVCGMSMGGFIAQWIAVHWPQRVRRLVLTCTAPQRPVPRPPMGGGMTGTMFSAEFAAQHPEVVSHWLRVGPACRPAMMLRQLVACAAFDIRGKVPSLRMPVLVVHGLEDRVIPAHHGHWLASHIPGARLDLYAGVGHAISIERAPEYNRRVLSFLRDTEATGDTRSGAACDFVIWPARPPKST